MYHHEKTRYSRTVSRIAAGEYDAYQEPVTAESLGCLLSEQMKPNTRERVMQFSRVLERENHYYEFRHKKASLFDCDNPEDSDTEYAFLPTDYNEVWGCGVNSDTNANTPPYGITYDSEQPFGSPDRRDERMTSTPVPPVQVHKYPHPVHKVVSSLSGDLGLDLGIHKDSPETVSIAEQPPSVEIPPPTPSVDATIPKKKKNKKAKRNLKHTGKKAKARIAAAAAAAAAETIEEHGVFSEQSDDNEDTVVRAGNIPAPSDISNPIEADLAEKAVAFTPGSYSAPDKDSLTSRQPSSEIDTKAAAKHGLAQHAIDITLAIDRQGTAEREWQDMDKIVVTADVEISEEAWDQEACFADDEQSPEELPLPMWDEHQSLLKEQRTEREVANSTQWNSPYSNIICHTYSICAWQPACRFHQRKVDCGCWLCPLPQRSCCCAHAPVDCFYHSLLPEDNPAREYKRNCSGIWRGPFTYREHHTSIPFTSLTTPGAGVSIPSSPHQSSLSFSLLPHPPPPTSSIPVPPFASSYSDFENIRTMAGSAAKQKRAGRLIPAIPLPPRNTPSSSQPSSKPATPDDELTPSVSALLELSRKSRSSSGSSKSTHTKSPSPPAAVEISMSTQPTMKPAEKHTRDKSTFVSITNTPSSQKTIKLNFPAQSLTERKSWADLLRVSAERDDTIESAMKSPSEYFDAKQSPPSSPETTNPSSKHSTPPNCMNQDSIQLTATHSRLEPNPSSPCPPSGSNIPAQFSGVMYATSKPPGKKAKSSKFGKGAVISSVPSSNAPRGKKKKNFRKKSQVPGQFSSSDGSRTVSPEKDEQNDTIEKHNRNDKNDKSDKKEKTKQIEKSQKASNHPSAISQEQLPAVETPGLGGSEDKQALPLFADSPNIVENLRDQFGNPAYSDIQILVGSQQSQNAQNFGPGSNYEVFYVHMPMLHLSPFMRQMIEAKAYGHNDGLRYIHVVLGSSFNLVPAFSMALQYMYSTPLITAEKLWGVVLSSVNHGLVYGKTIGEFQPGIAMVHFSFCYAASGVFLNLPDVIKRGMELAHGNIAWNTVELFLRFGMAPSAYMMTCPELRDEMIGSPVHGNGDTEEPWPPKINMSHMKEFIEKWPGMTTNLALQFIANAITPRFVIYERAQSKFAPSRIPCPLWTLPNSQCPDPRLEGLRFGNFPSYAETAPTDQAVLVPSAMLLTLPFGEFCKLLTILKKRGNARVGLVSEVVRLREARRLQAVRQYQGQIWPPGTIYVPSLQELAYRELVMCDDSNANPSINALQASVMRIWVGLSHPKMEALKQAH